MKVSSSFVLLAAAALSPTSVSASKDKGKSSPLLGNSFGTPGNATYDYIVVGTYLIAFLP